MALHTGCILDSHQGKHRISIMSRHAQNDGKTPDDRLVGKFDDHWVELAPPPLIVGTWYKSDQNDSAWENFAQSYLEHLEKPRVKTEVEHLITLARNREIVVLCIEEMPADPSILIRCHRRLLAEKCRELAPHLKITIK